MEEEERIMIKNLGSKDLKAKEEPRAEKVEREKPKLEGIKVVGKIDLEKKAAAKEPEPVVEQPKVEVAPPVVVEPPKKQEEPVVVEKKVEEAPVVVEQVKPVIAEVKPL